MHLRHYLPIIHADTTECPRELTLVPGRERMTNETAPPLLVVSCVPAGLKRTFQLKQQLRNRTTMASQLLVVPCGVTESRMQQVMNILSGRGEDNPNIASAAREFRERAGGRDSNQKRSDLVSINGLVKMKSLHLCLYLDRLEATGTTTRKQMITSCANDILS